MSKRHRTGTVAPVSNDPLPARRARRTAPEPRRRVSARGLLLTGGAILGLALVTLVFLGAATQPAYACDSLLPAASTGPDGTSTEDLGSVHVATGADLRYAYCPPASGDHFAARGAGPIPPNFYEPESVPSPGGWIHNLEHGYVVALYSCAKTCPSEADLAALRSFQANGPATASAQSCGIRSKVLTARFDAMSTPFALLAWNRASLLDTFDPAAAREFASHWVDQAPEAGAC